MTLLGLLTKIKYSITKDKMYTGRGEKIGTDGDEKQVI